MDLSAADAWTSLRKRFRDWAFLSSRQLSLRGGILLLLLDGEGFVVECERIAGDNGPGGVPVAKPGTKWSDAVNRNNAISRSLASGKPERDDRSAAAPLPFPVDGRRLWCGLYAAESSEAGLVRELSELWASIELELKALAERRPPGRLLLLLETVRSFQGISDAGEVMNVAVRWLRRQFPGSRFQFLLAQDIGDLNGLVRPLAIRPPADDLCGRAYIEGRPLAAGAERREEGAGIREVAAPLKGKQGVYGIIHLFAGESDLTAEDVEYLVMLAENAGAAFEFAKLYEQSTARVKELRIINDITKRLNRSLQIGEVLQFTSTELVSIFSADYCCLLQIDNEKRQLVVQASNAEQLLNEKFDIHYGFAGLICRSGEPVMIRDYSLNPQIESKLMRVTRARSLIGSPVIVNGTTVGAILLAHRNPNFFTYENFKLLQVISGHIGLALANANLHAEMRRMVITDQLTGLYVRHYLYEQIQHLQKRELRGSLIVADIDNFKVINDTFGHQIGDKVLVQVAKIISGCIRETDIAARWGGEELAVYLPQMDAKQAYKVADRIRHSVTRETYPQVTISCGVADWTREEIPISVDTLFHRADMALYAAKNSGKNQIRLYRL